MSSVALDANVAAAKLKVRRHRQLVIALRVAFGVGMLVSWELLSRTKTIDPFFFGMPSGIARVVWRWGAILPLGVRSIFPSAVDFMASPAPML